MSLGSLPPGTDESRLVIARKVFVNDTELSDEVSLVKLIVNKAFNKISYAKLIITDGSAPERDFPLSNDDMYKPGNPVEVQLGSGTDAETVFKGIIIKHGIKVQQNGPSLLIIEAKDEAVKLTGARKSKYFVNKTDYEIMTELATTPEKDIEDTTFSHPQMVQYDATDWDFLLTRAEANSMLVLTDDNKLIAKKPAVSASVFTATYGDNIWEFEADMDARRQFLSVGAAGWDYTQQQPAQAETGTAEITENGNLSSDDLGAVIGANVVLNHTGHLTQDQLQDWANAYAMHNKLSKAVGRVRVDGTALVKPGMMITLDGVGDRFNGDVFVSGVLHQYDGDWITDIQFGWKEEWFYKKEDVMDKPAGGLLPGITGLQIGVVLAVHDSTETLKQYRVKVHVPTITSGNEGIWARVATPDAGPDRGIYFRPHVNDEVVLGFLNDDPREAIILGYLHSKDTNKSPFTDTSDSVREFGIWTKEKLKIILDDTNKKLTLSAPVGEQAKTIILNDSGAIEIKDENMNSIKMDSSGITIQAGAGKNVVIKGTMVQIN